MDSDSATVCRRRRLARLRLVQHSACNALMRSLSLSRVAAVVAFVVVVVVGTVGCRKTADEALPSALPSAPPAPPAAGPHFVHDDIEGAFATARSSAKLVFVDAWAPWCHTCLSMQRDVLQDPALAAYADRLVFAAIDTDQPSSASFVKRFGQRAWPTFFVIDPATDQVLGLHGGSLSLAELRALFDAALAARAEQASPQVQALLAAHQASKAKDDVAAARFYVEAAALPGPRQGEAVIGAIRSYAAAHDDQNCIAFGLRSLHALQTSSSSSDLGAYLFSCASRLTDGPPKAEVLTALRVRMQQLADSPPAGASVDDRADTLAILADIASAQQDPAAHQAAHTKRLALLESDANARTNVDDARVHDYARMNSYLALGRGDDAVTLLRLRTSQLPTSYEAWGRLAQALHQLQRDDEARPAALKAIEFSYGPRRLRYRTLLADIEGAGPRVAESIAAERQAVQALVADAEQMPPGQRDENVIAAAKKRLAALP